MINFALKHTTKSVYLLCGLLFVPQIFCLIPPKFQWKTIDYVWESNQMRETAVDTGDFIPENNIPTGIVRWKDKLFINIPRWKKGVPSSLNFIYVNGTQDQPLNPYPSWGEAFIPNQAESAPYNSTVVCAFRAHIDACGRLWTVDNGVSDITGDAKQIAEPSIMIFNLNTDQLVHKYELGEDVLRESSVLTSIVVDIAPGKGKDCSNSYAYITDMGSNAIVVYDFKNDDAWRVENPYFHFDPLAGVYNVGGIDFYWSDGVSSAALSKMNNYGYRDLYFHPTSSTKQFKMSTKLLRNKNTPNEDIFNGVLVIGDKGPKTQATACDYDTQNNVLFYTQLSKNGVGCWNTDKPFNIENNPLIFSDCNMMEFPNDIKVDYEGNLWMLSNRQARFLYGKMDFNEVNFRVLTAPTAQMIRGTPCEKLTTFNKIFSCSRAPGSATSKKSINKSSKKESNTNNV